MVAVDAATMREVDVVVAEEASTIPVPEGHRRMGDRWKRGCDFF